VCLVSHSFPTRRSSDLPFLLATQAVLIRADLQFSAQGLGIAVSTAFASAALFTFCCGPVFRQLSFRAGIGISGAIVAAGSFGTVYWVNSFESLLVSMVVLGSANACCQVTANSVIATAVPAHRRRSEERRVGKECRQQVVRR